MRRILVVDDQPEIVRLLQELLQREYLVDTASNGDSALRQIAERPPDIVILDVVMPVMDGYGVLARLKSEPATAGIAVIMLTVRVDTDDVRLGTAFGADYYIAKPFDPRDVLALVRKHLAASGETAPFSEPLIPEPSGLR